MSVVKVIGDRVSVGPPTAVDRAHTLDSIVTLLLLCYQHHIFSECNVVLHIRDASAGKRDNVLHSLRRVYYYILYRIM